MVTDALQALCQRLDGALTASVVSNDGLIVDAFVGASATSLEDLWAEYSGLLGQAQRSAQMLAAGPMEELVLTSERLLTIVRPVTSDYFLAFAARSDANAAKARYLCRVTAPLVREALEG